MSPANERVVVLSACADTAALAQSILPLAARTDELIVAIDGAHERPDLAPLVQRWSALRTLLAPYANAWVTPLVRTASLPTLADQCAALHARVGAWDVLYTDSEPWLDCARQLGAQVAPLPAPGSLGHGLAPITEVSRALVVLRAQPFHRGHLALVERALALSSEVVLVVAAAQRSHTMRDPFTAGERLALIRAGLGPLRARVWLLAMPAPTWPAMALSELPFVAPRFERIVAHNPVLCALAAQQRIPVDRLETPLAVHHQTLSATSVRARLTRESAGRWLQELLPEGTAELLWTTPELAQRCELIAAAGG